VLPVARVFYTAFVESDGAPTLGHFSAFFSQGLMQESFFNSLYRGGDVQPCSPR
jgi:iron(III) transport system permease protein